MELFYLTEIGMEPLEALRAGTVHAAECMGWEDRIGTLDRGKIADIVITGVDPVDEIEKLSDPGNIQWVIRDGVIYRSPDD
ncbi:predicted hydrolase [Methanothermobacter marburgensis str. Marburg]|uniref:Predicted hydrolase n=1 Tax=Methanothermobacter marburgensis (strain ATCC BAA-927 / DSM 2133 / JCM 14651 / NBRC 100331 / OCM 82 / Marburg) TaxID=79929 RepID=D9PU28_METTM|nr:predicted hydrolase [Methanothermobacter marburgensis str. Marburg]